MYLSDLKTERNDEYGYTLIELLVVLVILGLVVGIVAPQAMKHLGNSKSKAARIQIERLTAVLDLFYLDISRYPTTEEGLSALVIRPQSMENWGGPYIRRANGLIDPWGNAYIYNSPGENGEFDLYSLGADGKVGGNGQNADIKTWD